MDAGPTTSLADPPVTASRQRILARTRLDFWLDALLLVAYTLAYSLGFTGIAGHEWLGIGLGVVLLVHLTLHWDWVIRTTRKLLRRGRPAGGGSWVWPAGSPPGVRGDHGVIRIHSDNGFDPADTGDLIPDLRDRGGAGGRRDHGQRRPAAAPPDAAYRRQGVEKRMFEALPQNDARPRLIRSPSDP